MVEIKGPRVTLRNYKKDDIARVAEIANNKTIAGNMSGHFPYPYTLEDAEKWIKIAHKKKSQVNFAIEFEGELVGGAGFDLENEMNEGVASGGYWLGEDYWGKGLATEVWGLLRDYAFENFDIKRIGAGVFSWNPASCKVQEKCGFKKEGCIRDSVARFDNKGDEIKYGILRKEWEALNGKSTI